MRHVGTLGVVEKVQMNSICCGGNAINAKSKSTEEAYTYETNSLVMLLGPNNSFNHDQSFHIHN